MYDNVGYFLTTVAIIFAIIAVLFDSFFWGVFLCILYASSLVWGTQIICLVKNAVLSQSNENSALEADKSCGVCGNAQCKRHRRSHIHPIPKVPKGFDAALECLLEEILQTYVCTWYSSLSSNEAFVQQLRLAITTAATNITGRLYKADLSQIIFNNLIPLALHHAKDWQELTKKVKDLGGTPNDHIADFLGSRIHPAAYSREAELNYLRGLVATLLPHLLPATHVSINNQVILREVLANWVLLPAIDALADPDNLNMLIALCTHHEGKFSQSTDTIYVPMLQKWISNPQRTQDISNTLKPTLEEVLNDQDLLYLFMQHIKDSGIVNLLQFCLNIDDLSKRLLNPDMKPEMEETLHAEALKIYSTYLDPEGPDFLNLPIYISQGMKQILDQGPSKVQELRTSRPLYEAHQEAHTLLENTWLPSFHHTYQIYKFLCGVPVINTNVKTSTQNSMSSGGVGVGTRITTSFGKIRSVLKAASAVEGAPFNAQQMFQGAEETSGTSTAVRPPSRDLSTWRVSIPQVEGSGVHTLYTVAVHSVSTDRSWQVLRRDQDFYVLRARLSEFHGDKELNDSPLPTRKNANSSQAANRQRYQDFLQRLLAKPTLRSSELLHTFLTAPNLKSLSANQTTPDIGVLYQSMAHKLRKEKGQHLDKFMNHFLASTNSDLPDMGVEVAGDHTFNESQIRGRDLLGMGPFRNNLNLDSRIQNFPYIVNKLQHTKGACFCITEAIDSLIEVPGTFSKLLWVMASTFRHSLDPLINRWFYNMIVKLLSGGRAALVVKLLHSTIFDTDFEDEDFDTSSPKLEAEEHYNLAKSGLYNLVPWWVFGVHSKWCELMDSFLEPIQNAPFNKHLAYTLVDQLLINVFPELT
ncbi:sorting nexin-14-like isoform X2 [Trichogramma pretiosum]|uniref:Sorting nexin-14 n=1 Tax=Trichogramma kaykai TaxID=54128 RepID=A0ABD2W210_9HYME|nr:sorting nexin-14-like isoform X2 [Trichogramma pretiosum]